MSKFEIFPKEWTTSHDGHEIRVRNSWNRGIELFVDGVSRASSNDFFALNKSKPILSAEIKPETGASFVIDVFAYALLMVKVKLCVNGKKIAGDTF